MSAIGTISDTAVADHNSDATVISLLKSLWRGPAATLTTLAASAARTAGANGAAVEVTAKRSIVLLTIEASATDAGDTLDVYVDMSLDNVTWLNVAHFPQQAGNGAAAKHYAVLDPSAPGTSTINVTSDANAGSVRPSVFGAYVRARWAIVDSGNANQSHTFSVVIFTQA